MEERTEPKLWWRKLGRGSLRLGGRIIKPNERFQATESEIPKAFRDTIKLADKEEIIKRTSPPKRTLKLQRKDEGLQPSEAEDPKVEDPDPGDEDKKDPGAEEYNMVRKGVGWYDVVSTVTGKPINDKSLRKEEAVKLLEALT